MKIEGRHHWILKDLNGNTLKEEEHSNVATDVGLDTMVGLISNVSGSEPILSIAFGVGVVTGHSDANSTRSVTKDSARSEVDNYWKYADMTYTSGGNKGKRRRINSSSLGTLDHLSFPYIPEVGDSYVLTPYLGATQLGNEPTGSGWRKAVDVNVVQSADHIYDKNAVVRLIGEFSGSEAEGNLNECGLFTSLDPRGGVMIVADGFADIIKDPSKVLTWIWELTLSR